MTPRALLRRLLAVAVLTATLVTAFAVSRVRVQPFTVAALVGFAVVLVELAERIRPPAPAAAVSPARRPSGRDQLPDQLATLHRRVRQAAASQADFDAALRPLLVRLAEDRLAAAHGLTRARHPARARRLLGADLWALAAAQDRLERGPRTAAGPSVAAIRRLVDQIEEM